MLSVISPYTLKANNPHSTLPGHDIIILPRDTVEFDPTVFVFVKVTVNFSPLPAPLQCPSILFKLPLLLETVV